MADYVSPVNQYLKSIDLQPYDRYLPNAFNDSLSLLEKINKVVHHMNETNQITNEVVTKWNEFVDWVNTDGINQPIESKLNDLLSNGSFSEIIIPEIKKQTDETIKTVNTKLLNVDTKLVDIPQQVAMSDLNTLWEPPVQPSSVEVAPNTPTNPSTIINLYDTLKNAHPTYITKQSLGKDQSGLYDFHEYVFQPQTYEKTLIIGAGIHGRENMSVKVLYRFLKHLVEDYDKYPQLAYLRHRVRLVVLPIQNPWGYANNNRFNANGVDLNRNFDYKWNEWTETTKGSAPFSEKESQYIKQVFEKYPDATLHLDLHNTDDGKGFYCGIPRLEQIEKNALYQIVNGISPNSPLMFTKGSGPTVYTYSTRNFGFNALNIEWQPGGLGDEKYSSGDMTKSLKFLGNVIIKYSTFNKPIFEKVKEPKVIKVTTQHTSVATTTVNQWEELTQLNIELSPECDGIIEVIGSFSSQNSDVNALTYFTNAIVQPGHDYIGENSVTRQQAYADSYAVFNGKQGNLTVLNSANVYGTRGNTDDHHGNVFIKFYFKANQGVLSLRRNRIMIKFTPTDKVDRFTEYVESVATGNTRIEYPKTYETL